MHMYVHCSTIHNSKDMESIWMPANSGGIKKMWYIYTMEYYAAIKEEQNHVLCSTMDAAGSHYPK